MNKYQQKISGPILDRIDLQVELSRLSTDERFAKVEKDVSPRLRAKIESARERQRQRFEGQNIPFNAAMSPSNLRELCRFSNEGFDQYKCLIDSNALSTRSMDRLAKVARTVADLDNSDDLKPQHVDKAASFVIGGILREAQ